MKFIETGLERISPKKGKKLTLEKEGDCVVCTSHDPNPDGYIRIYQSKNAKAQRFKFLHRMVWEHNVGMIPEDHEIDHKCRNRRCCNLDHLQILHKSTHKAKTNKERYAERIEGVQFAIEMGFSNKKIEEAFNVTTVYINRHRRVLNNQPKEIHSGS